MIIATFRFAKRSRLRSQSDFANVFSKSFKIHGQGFTLFFRPNVYGYPRLGLAISRKVSTRAVIRNRVKRAVRESFRLNQAKIGAFDIVFIGQPALATTTSPVFYTALQKAWLKMVQRCGN